MSFVCKICAGVVAEPWLDAVPDYEYGLPYETTLVNCPGCGTVQQNPLPGADELARYYPRDYHAYHYKDSRVADWLKMRYSRGVGRAIRDIAGPTGRILDVGCGDGSFLVALEVVGDWELHGIDINPEVVREPLSQRLHLRAGQIERGLYPAGFFDAVVATHLVEHVHDPLDFMRTCFDMLRPGGVLIGELPNLDCWDRAVFGRYWGGLHLPRHLFFWDPKSFAALGRSGGFADARTYPVLQPAHWAISLQNWLVHHFPRLRALLRHGRLPGYVPAVIASTPLCWLQNRFGRPSIMGFSFRKAVE